MEENGERYRYYGVDIKKNHEKTGFARVKQDAWEPFLLSKYGVCFADVICKRY